MVGVDSSKIPSVRVVTDIPGESSNEVDDGLSTCYGNERFLLKETTFWLSDVGDGRRLDAELY